MPTGRKVAAIQRQVKYRRREAERSSLVPERPINTRQLREGRPLAPRQCSSWEEVTLNETKLDDEGFMKCIPIENVDVPQWPTRKDEALACAEQYLEQNTPTECPYPYPPPAMLRVKLNVPDGAPGCAYSDDKTLANRAKHLCGGKTDYCFDSERAKFVGCIVDTLTSPAIIAENHGDLLYLRRYRGGAVHVVVIKWSENRNGQLQGKLITQYPDTRGQRRGTVIYKNPALVRRN